MGDTETARDEADQEVEVVGRCFPYGFRRECKELFRLAWPLTLSILFHYLIQPISLMFCGHLGSHQLASVGMAISVIYVTTVSLGRGLAFGGDTYFSQTYGSTNKLKMGIYLQRGIIFGVLTSCVIWAIQFNTENILLLIGQDPIVSKLAQEYVLLFSPGVLAYCWLFMLMRYLLCQNRVIPNMIICMASCGVNAILHYGLLYQAHMGIKGSAIALMSTYYLVLMLFVAYIWGSGIYKETWPGWSWECLEDWGPFGHTAVSSMVMTFIFWLCTEVGTFLSGILGEKEISAFQILFQVEGFAWMIPLGLGGACTARVGQYLGSNRPLGAITATRVSLTITIFISLTMAIACYAGKHYIPMPFTNSAEVLDYTEQLVPILAIFLLLEGFGGIIVGIVRGSGRQTLGAVIIFVSYYIVGLPVGVPLMYLTYLGQAGLWWGYVLGLGVQDISLALFVITADWHEEARKAQVRAGMADKVEDHVNGSVDSHTESHVDERTRLLQGEGQIQRSSRYGGSEEYDEIGVVTVGRRAHRLRLVVLRLAIFLAAFAILAAGVLMHVYVHVTPHEKWQILCIPPNETWTTRTAESLPEVPSSLGVRSYTTPALGSTVGLVSPDTTVLPENTTLPFCNFTHSKVWDALYPNMWTQYIKDDMKFS